MTDIRPPTSPSGSPTAADGPAADDIGYADALDELEAILDELDGDEVDVDVLGARVRRAAELLRLCRARIAGARFEVEQVVSELEAEAEAAGSVAAGSGSDVTAPDADADDEVDADADADDDLDDTTLDDRIHDG